MAEENCGPHFRGVRAAVAPLDDETTERAAAMFRAVGDVGRLRLLHHLDSGEWCVSELAEATATKLSTLSQQLRVLYAERIVKRRRDGRHVYYSLADDHVRELVHAALTHAEHSPRAIVKPSDPSPPDEPEHDP